MRRAALFGTSSSGGSSSSGSGGASSYIAQHLTSRLRSDLCCGPAAIATAATLDEERPMMSPNVSSSSSNTSGTSSTSVSTSTSSCASYFVVQQDWKQKKQQAPPTPSASAAGSAVSPSPGKRIMVVVDDSREAKTALLWALSHVAQKLGIVTLLYVLPSKASHCYDPEDSRAVVSDKARLRSEERGCELMASLKSLCALRQPEVDVEAVVLAGEKGPAIVRQAKKLDVSVLVLGHKKPNLFQRCLRWNKDDQLVDYCIQHADCLTLSVRRKSKHSGYLINSKWQKNFWLLA